MAGVPGTVSSPVASAATAAVATPPPADQSVSSTRGSDSGAAPVKQGSSDSHGPLLLLSCGGDGTIRVWHISGMGKLVCTLPGAQGKLEQVGMRHALVCANQETVLQVFKTCPSL